MAFRLWTLDFGPWTFVMQVNLKVLAGPYKDRVFCFTQPDTFLIGRTRDSHLYLPDDRFFSRHHCLLEISPPHCLLRDLGSTNGTFVNGRKVSEASLQNGDKIQGGETVLLVEVVSGEKTDSNLVPSMTSFVKSIEKIITKNSQSFTKEK